MRHTRCYTSARVANISATLITVLVVLCGNVSLSSSSPTRFVVAAFTPQRTCTDTAITTTRHHYHYHYHYHERRTIVLHVNSGNDDDDDEIPASTSRLTSPPPNPPGGAYLRRVARGIQEMGNMKESVETGDVIFAKADIDSLGIYRDVGYDVTSIYHQGLSEDTGRIEKRPVVSLDEPVPRGYTRYVTLYSPVHHGDDIDRGAVIVTPEEVGLVSMKAEVIQSLLLAVPGLFWVGLCITFTNIYTERYGGTFMDAFLGR